MILADSVNLYTMIAGCIQILNFLKKKIFHIEIKVEQTKTIEGNMKKYLPLKNLPNFQVLLFSITCFSQPLYMDLEN